MVFKLSRERSKKTEAVFLVGSRRSGGKPKSPPNREFSSRFGKEEMSTEDKRRRLRRLVPSWSFLTRLRRPYLFPRAGKDRGEKGAWLRLARPASEFRQDPMFQALFHTILTSQASDYAPPDTEVSGLQLVAVERLLSIEGALEIQMNFTFLRGPCRGGTLLRPYRTHPKAPLPGELARRSRD